MRTDPPPERMPERECWDKLRSGSIGHVGLSARALPVIVPVSYVVDDGTVLMCLGPDVPFGAVVDEVVAAFQVESIDPVTGAGWSVHAQGIVRPVIDGQAGHCPPGDGRLLRLEPVSVVGRHLELCRPSPQSESGRRFTASGPGRYG